MNLRSIKFTLFFYLFIFFTSIISAQISGTVFRDFNSNGVKDNTSTFNEPFVSGITVTAFPASGLSQTTTTNSSGAYSFTGLTFPVRLEFTGYQLGDFSATKGTNNNTSVQFYSAATTTANFGVNYPSDYCQTDPAIVTPVYVNGRQSGTEAFYSFPSSATGQTSATNNTLLAQSQEIGSTWGVAYDRVNQIIYTSAFLKRHVSLVDNNGDGIEDIGAIYTMSPSGSPSLWLDFQSLADVGLSLMPTIATRALPTDKTQPSHDGTVYDLVGKIGIGDIDISDDYKTLYLVNLYDKKVYSIDIATKTLIGSGIPLPNPCTGGSVRPFGLKYHRGKVYVGTVCDAQTSQSVSDLKANLYRLDAGTFNNILNIPIDYLKGIARTGGNANSDNWNPWTSTFFTSYYFEGYPQPIFADIEFDINEDVILVFDDRYGHQMGTFNYNTTTGSNLYTGIASGDILRASYSGGTYTLENNGSVGGLNSSGGIGNNQGPGGGEFYYQEEYISYHNETVEGGTALRAGSGQVAVAAFDPFGVYSAGIYWMNNTNGKTDRKYEVNSQGEVTGSFGKANGIGDIEMLCDPAPLEIGNRVWMDTDSDGVQDADEMGLDNITVKLFSGTTLVATKTTSNGGQYYFNTADGVLPNTPYTIRIEGASFPLNKTVTLKDQTTGGSQDLGDNDASMVGANADITYTTGNIGENNHTLDFGFKSGPTCTLSATCSSSPQTSCTPVNGSASVTATGAQGNLSYLWSSGETTSSISNKSAGTYTVTVTDDILSGCTATCQAIISNNTTPPTVSCSKIDNSNCATPNGSATATASGVTYLWSNGATTATITGLNAGTYTVTVTNTTSSCTNTCSVTVTNTSTPPSVSCGKVDNTNCATPNGSATATASGVSYLWSNGGTTATITGLNAGTYTVTVTSTTSSCTNTCSVTVVNNTTNPTANCSVVANTNCATPNGSASVTTDASNPTYLWSNGGTTSTITGLNEGTYTVTVTNTASSCTNTCSAIVTNTSTPPSVSCGKVDNTNCATPNGSATATASGVTYLWSNGGTIATITGLNAGTYTVTVTSTTNACTATCSATVLNNTINPTASCTPTANTNCTSPNGQATVTTNASNPSYVWSNGQTTATITGLNAGTYTVTVTNTTNSCTNTCSAIVVSSTSPPSISCTPTQPTCAAPNGGSVSTSVTGGITPFTYLWSNGVTASIISNVGAGTYTVTVTDNNNCTASCSAVLNAPVGCCEINNLNLVIGNCDNKGTLANASDDEYTFTLNPTGNGIGTTYTVSGLPNSPQTGTYGSPTTFGPYLISTGVLNITVVDNVSNTCSKTASVSPPPSCSVCNVAPPVLTVTDNICPSRTGTINLVQGCGAGTFIQYSINNGTSWSSIKPLYSTTPRTILARCVNSMDTTCKSLNTTVTTAPKKCPTDGSECSLIANATIDPCNNNGTDNISTDDYFTIQVSATVANGGSSNKYEVVIGADPLTGIGGNVLNSGGTNYGSPVTIGNTKIFLADGTSTYQLVIRDINNNNCFQIINIDPVASCSNAPPKSPCYPVPCVPIGLIKN